MAVPANADRCPSCRARRRHGVVPVSSALTGPAAADAWERAHTDAAWSAAETWPSDGRAEVGGDVHAAKPIGPGAAAAHSALRIVELAGLAVAAIGVVRAGLAVAVDDGTELRDLGWWNGLSAVAVVGVVVAGGTTAGAVVLILRWAAAAGHNLGALALDVRRWVRRGEQVVARLVVLVGLVVAWWIVPSGPDRADRALDLGLAVFAAVALVMVAGAAQRLLASVTTVELHRAETLARMESASADRPRSRA